MKNMIFAVICLLLLLVTPSQTNSALDIEPDSSVTSNTGTKIRQPDTKRNSSVSALAGPVNDFSVAFMRRLFRANADTNVFASPFSVSTALSMLSMGARTTTEQQLRKGLKFDQLSSNELVNKTVHNLFQEVRKDSVSQTKPSHSIKQVMNDRFTDDPSLLSANYILVQKELTTSPVLQDFKNNLQSLYSAKVDDVDFVANANQIQTDVNNWVNQTTRGLIDDMLSAPPAAGTLMILLNAIYFKGLWKKPFDKQNTRKISFYNRGKNVSQEVDFMTAHGSRVLYAELEMAGQKIQALELEYKDNSTSMIILLPDQRNGLEKIIANASFESEIRKTLDETNSMTITKVNVKIPKFKIETDYVLNPILVDMDMTNMFTGDADFSGITGTQRLHVSKVKHKAVVKVDEEGTEAAAVTMIMKTGNSATSAPVINFVADHPFLFLIKDKATGIILFIGKVEEFS